MKASCNRKGGPHLWRGIRHKVWLVIKGAELVTQAHRCSGLQTVSDGLANNGAFEPTTAANMRDRESTLTANELRFRLLGTFDTAGEEPNGHHSSSTGA
jgi:hypothetical protein